MSHCSLALHSFPRALRQINMNSGWFPMTEMYAVKVLKARNLNSRCEQVSSPQNLTSQFLGWGGRQAWSVLACSCSVTPVRAHIFT